MSSTTVGEAPGNVGALTFRLTGVNVNQTNTDIGTFTGLPSRYIVRRLTFDNASNTPTLSTVSLYTAAAAGGLLVVSAQALATMNATTVFLDAVLALTTTVLTANSLFLRAIAAAGGASTCDVTLEVEPLV